MNLKPIDLKQGLYVVSGDEAAPKFTHIEAALGWLDPDGEDHATQHALLVGGRQEDGRFRVILEYQGNAGELSATCIDAKDALCVRRFWCDPTAETTVNHLREIDGLTHYKSWGKDAADNEMWDVKDPKAKWTYFRAIRPLAAIVPVPDRIRVDIQGGLDRIVALTHAKRLLVTKTCQNALWVLDQKRKDIERHPIALALIWLTWALEEDEKIAKMSDTVAEEWKPLYPNREII